MRKFVCFRNVAWQTWTGCSWREDCAGDWEEGLCTHTQVIISESEELEANLGAFVKFPT